VKINGKTYAVCKIKDHNADVCAFCSFQHEPMCQTDAYGILLCSKISDYAFFREIKDETRKE
jgi:hypothetical protein